MGHPRPCGFPAIVERVHEIPAMLHQHYYLILGPIRPFWKSRVCGGVQLSLKELRPFYPRNPSAVCGSRCEVKNAFDRGPFPGLPRKKILESNHHGVRISQDTGQRVDVFPVPRPAEFLEDTHLLPAISPGIPGDVARRQAGMREPPPQVPAGIPGDEFVQP